jgi:hypothetical protein
MKAKKIGTKIIKEKKINKLKAINKKWCLATDSGPALDRWSYAIDRQWVRSIMIPFGRLVYAFERQTAMRTCICFTVVARRRTGWPRVRSIALDCDRSCSAEIEFQTSVANTETPKKTPFSFFLFVKSKQELK